MTLYQVTVLIESDKHPGVVAGSVDKVLTKAGAKVREVAIDTNITVERFDGIGGEQEGHREGEVQSWEPPKDSDPFPFGKYGPKQAGLTYGEVPARYYDWISGEEWLVKWPAVEAYIVANRAQIDSELDE